MSRGRVRVLYVTDLAYEARGRRYCDEDIFLSARLRESFDIALCHPADAVRLMGSFDVVVVRNSGPVIHYRDEYDAFRRHALSVDARVFTEMSGRGDMAGKRYLLDLFDAGYPVIPTVSRAADLHRLPAADSYVVKPTFGADSVGLRFVPRSDLGTLTWDDLLVQPRVDFRYEVSFYFVGRQFCYATYAPDVERRWDLQPYEADQADLAFAQLFVDWNAIDHGIQRVDACRTQAGELLLVELEDLNPYLSLDRVPPATRDDFIRAMTASVHSLAERH